MRGRSVAAGLRPRSAPTPLAGISEVADRYDALLCDVWGVIHNGREAYPKPCAALARWKRERGPVVLISNSPRPSADVAGQIQSLGVPDNAWSALVTSGDATRRLLAERAPGPAWRIGPARDAPLYQGLGLSFAGPADAAFISCTGLADDENEAPEDYRGVLAAPARRGLEMICANPDKVVQRGERLISCAGALAELYETLGGTVRMAGKPFAAIYELALVAAETPRERVLAIGDGVATDVIGANRQGIDVLFITSGVHGASLADDPAAVAALLEAHGGRADFVMQSLQWA